MLESNINYNAICLYRQILLVAILRKILNFIRIKEHVGETRSTVCTHRYADCLLQNTSTKDNNYVVNQKLQHVDDTSFRELFGRIRVVLKKIRSVSIKEGQPIIKHHRGKTIGYRVPFEEGQSIINER